MTARFAYMFALPDEATIEKSLTQALTAQHEEFIAGVVVAADKVVTPDGLLKVVTRAYLDSPSTLGETDLTLVACVICQFAGKPFMRRYAELLRKEVLKNPRLRARLITPMSRAI